MERRIARVRVRGLGWLVWYGLWARWDDGFYGDGAEANGSRNGIFARMMHHLDRTMGWGSNAESIRLASISEREGIAAFVLQVASAAPGIDRSPDLEKALYCYPSGVAHMSNLALFALLVV